MLRKNHNWVLLSQLRFKNHNYPAVAPGSYDFLHVFRIFFGLIFFLYVEIELFIC